jgi:hypothetical protein
MKPSIKNTIAVIGGIIIGGAVNMGIVMMSSSIIPPPEGIDPSNMESLKSGMHLFEPKHFLFPFLAHALGTLTGAAFTSFFAASLRMRLALLIGSFFLIGGIVNAYILPAPAWFLVVDLVGAYLPMAWWGHRLIRGKAK